MPDEGPTEQATFSGGAGGYIDANELRAGEIYAQKLQAYLEKSAAKGLANQADLAARTSAFNGHVFESAAALENWNSGVADARMTIQDIMGEPISTLGQLGAAQASLRSLNGSQISQTGLGGGSSGLNILQELELSYYSSPEAARARLAEQRRGQEAMQFQMMQNVNFGRGGYNSASFVNPTSSQSVIYSNAYVATPATVFKTTPPPSPAATNNYVPASIPTSSIVTAATLTPITTQITLCQGTSAGTSLKLPPASGQLRDVTINNANASSASCTVTATSPDLIFVYYSVISATSIAGGTSTRYTSNGTTWFAT